MKEKNIKPDAKKAPKQVNITMYNVGFGDCFLLTFLYNNNKSVKILIDCGTSTEDKKYMGKIVDEIAKDCNNKLDAIVITHRHLDHLSAFNDDKTGAKLESLKPGLIVQPWTEHPDTKSASLEAPSVFPFGVTQHLNYISGAQNFVSSLLMDPDKILSGMGTRSLKIVKNIASINIPNAKAVQRLQSMIPKKNHAYVYAGSDSGLEKILPGVEVSVLGPPTLKQTKSILKQKSQDAVEFWKLYSKLAIKNGENVPTVRGSSALFPRAKTLAVSKSPSFVRWVVKKLDSINLQNVNQIVRSLDKAINNTSIILLFKFGGKSLLFSGDAQLENWTYALQSKTNLKKLANVTTYKVGHHGSKNATPKSMWNIISKKKKSEFITLLSTKKYKHDGVPKKSLVDALETTSTLYNTLKLSKKLSVTITI